MSLQTKQIIFELEEDEIPSAKKKNEQLPSHVVDRKLGCVTYIKWGTLYNYFFSFDLTKGRLLCYKTEQSRSPENYYVLIQGQFVQDEDEIRKQEQLFQKKKNYSSPVTDDLTKTVIYVKTKKSKTFRLITNESHDKIVGYLQMCFNSKLNLQSQFFFAMLGVGIIGVKNATFKLITGILVPLDNWNKTNSQQNYLVKKDELKISQLVNNGQIIGALISAFENRIISLIFNPTTQTVDVIEFNDDLLPKQYYDKIFLLKKLKRGSIQNSLMLGADLQKSQLQPLIKLHTNLNLGGYDGEYSRIAEGKSVQVLCKENLVDQLNLDKIQEKMFKTQFLDDSPEDDQNNYQDVVARALNFYKKSLTRFQQGAAVEDSKEFILVCKYKLVITDEAFNFQKDELPDDIQTKGEYQISDENNDAFEPLRQITRTINIQMNRQRNSQASHGDSPEKKISLNSDEQPNDDPSPKFQDQVKENELKAESASPEEILTTPQFLSPVEDQILMIEPSPDEPDEDDEADDGAAKVKETYPTQSIRGQKNILKFSLDFEFLNRKDEFRVETAYEKGGTANLDKAYVNFVRNVGKQMIREIGQKIISGNFNLSTVSFPIKAMIARSGLEKAFMQTIYFPLYINRAAQIQEPLERLKLLMVAVICNFVQANTFFKPLNPILGETFEGSYDDGTQLYGEQISHHPPVSYFLVVGPQKSYKLWGYYLFNASAGFNNLGIKNSGKRAIQFADGQKISFNFNSESYSGTFMGTMRHESSGTITFSDTQNQLEAVMTLGKVKKRPTDYVEAEIKQSGKIVSKMYGSYMGFLEWDGVRYWDARDILPFRIKVEPSSLQSDHSTRSDLNLMLTGDLDAAQKAKESLELSQRSDAKLRKEYFEKQQQQLKKDAKKKK